MQTVPILLLLAGAGSTFASPSAGDRQRRASGSASSGAFATAGGSATGAGGGDGFYFPEFPSFGPASLQTVFRNFFDQMDAMMAQHQEQANNFRSQGFGGDTSGAQASLNVDNRGGFGQAQLFPDPQLRSRIAGDVDPLSGGPVGVFSSSSSSSHVDPSGKTHTFKQATVGVNDNGKVKIFSVKDP